MVRRIRETAVGKISYLFRAGDLPTYFLHGLGGTGNTWLRLSRLLRNDLELYFIDLLGHGRSDKMLEHLTIDDQCEAVQSFVELGKKRGFSLVGNSYGGLVALQYALTREPKPDYLVLIDSADIQMVDHSGSYVGSEEYVREAIAMSDFNDERAIRYIANEFRKRPMTSPLRHHKKIKIETMIIRGENDALLPAVIGSKLKSRIPNSSFHVIRGAGHVPQSTHAAELASLMNLLMQ